MLSTKIAKILNLMTLNRSRISQSW